MPHRLVRALRSTLLWAGLLLQVWVPAWGGQLFAEDIERQFGEKYIVGEKLTELPVYPLFAKSPNPTNATNATNAKPELKAYVFESIDIAPVRGYAGRPLNILIVLDVSGKFLQATLIDHREPIFIDSWGNAKLVDFAAQYAGLSFTHNTHIGSPNEPGTRNETSATVKGVHRGTISAKAIDRTLLTAASVVAQRLMIAAPAEDKAAATATPTPQTAAPAASASAPVSSSATQDAPPGGPLPASAVDSARKAMRAGPGLASPLPASAEPTDDAAGRPGSTAQATSEAPARSDTDAAPVASGASDASTRAPGRPDSPQSQWQDGWQDGWKEVWHERRVEIALLLAGLLLLSIGLVASRRISADARTLRITRTLYLLFTVGFIGAFAQGQLTVVNITAAIDSLRTGGDLSFLMNDPMTVILWIYVGITLFIWGRGTFCGWLCPFGALQELISLIANAVGLRQRRVRTALDARLKWLKYGVLAVLIGSLFIAPSFAPVAAEVEPFKTAISLFFVRDWPYVLWAVACLALGVVVYRGYCRYLCPLGAALASVNVLQRWSWIPRREACGTPCQTCRHRCEYQAITPAGAVQYHECFQCLDCVNIYQDEQRCLPLIAARRTDKRIVPIMAMASASSREHP